MKLKSFTATLPGRCVLALFCSLLATALLAADKQQPAQFESLTLGDQVVKNARVREVTPTYVVVTYDGGGSKLDRKNLPPELQSLYPYDAKAAAAFEKQKAEEQVARDQKQRAMQAGANRRSKADLQSQKAATENKIAALQKELKQLEKEMAPMKGKARGKRTKSPERQDLDAARDKKEDLIHRIGEQQAILDRVNKQLDAIP